MVELIDETPRTRSLILELPEWLGHRSGQHVDVRLTAEDGYQAERSYSIASSPKDSQLVLTVERLDDGEVSPYLVGELRAGDELELRGPIGGYFIWEQALGGPLMLIAGGSGIVPFRAMIRHRMATGSEVPLRLLYSARSTEELIYHDELREAAGHEGVGVQVTLTREWPEDWSGHRGRIDARLLDECVWAPAERPLIYSCGPTALVESVANTLVEAGHDPQRIRLERFGPSGS